MVQIISSEDGAPKGCPQFPCQSCPCKLQEYILSCGAEIRVEAGKEVQQNFVLEKSAFKDCGTISGIVKDCKGNLIHNALIKVFDTQHKPVTHVFTNKEGQFLICLPPGHYIIKAVK